MNAGHHPNAQIVGHNSHNQPSTNELIDNDSAILGGAKRNIQNHNMNSRNLPGKVELLKNESSGLNQKFKI